jgi:transposase
MSDHKGAALICEALPRANEMIADRGYDSDAFREALRAKGFAPCIPPRRNRKVQHPYDTVLYRQRHEIENMFGRMKDWRRIAMRYDRCAHTFMSAISIAAAVIFWINQ